MLQTIFAHVPRWGKREQGSRGAEGLVRQRLAARSSQLKADRYWLSHQRLYTERIFISRVIDVSADRIECHLFGRISFE